MNRGFNRIAPVYDVLARFVFGSAITESQLHFLPKLKNSKAILVLGGGTGWWLHNLQAINPHAEIMFIDSSAAMIELAKRNGASAKINFICGTEDSIPAGVSYDAVILFNFLDLFSNDSLDLILSKIENRVTPDSFWLVTDFMNDKRWHKLLLKIMYLFFYFFAGLRTLELPDWKRQLEKINLKERESQLFYSGFIQSALFQKAF